MALEAARKSMGGSTATSSEVSASVTNYVKEEVQAELDHRNAKGGKGRGAKRGAQGEE